MKTLYLVAGARPNFMKIAPLVRALRAHGANLGFKIIHTGQHYDYDLNEVFFDELGIPAPDVYLGAGSGSHAQQTARIMVGFEAACQTQRPDCVLVVGDVNSTLACSIVAKKLCIPVAHVEAGLRSGDMTMPEEINRIVTDAISDLLFVSEPSGVRNLLNEGRPAARIHHVGHVMVDNLLYQHDKLAAATSTFESSGLKRRLGAYGVVTLHRPSNVDTRDALKRIGTTLRNVAQRIPLVFPLHPRTRANLGKFGISLGDQVVLTGPLPYMDFLNLWKDARLVLTDSGGLQEETTVLGVPCVTMRENTERPITVEQGTNVLAGIDPEAVTVAAVKILEGRSKSGQRPDLWDGKAAERIVAIMERELV
ncbi:MAG: non-hydrolyzing UDP-N-acetylglucosamine 2-epimerase [Nevskiales bacterium]